MSAKLDTHPAEALGPARETARQLRERLSALEGDLAQALQAKDYQRAQAVQQDAHDLRPSVLLAEAHAVALEAAVTALREHDELENADALRRDREQQAETARAAALTGERDAHAEAQQHLEAAQAAVAAAQRSLRLAFEAENREAAFRREANEIEISVGWAERAAFWSSPQNIQPAIDMSPVLTAIQRAI